MDIEKGNLEILFQKISYTSITLNCMNPKEKHDYSCVNEKLYMQYSKDTFPYSSEDERHNNYLMLKQSLCENGQQNPSVFRMIMDVARKLLIYDGKEIKCKFDELLRWREISFQLGQDFLACAFLAEEDLRLGHSSTYFAWLPIIRSDDYRLHNILNQGMAENHFHLNGSTKVFELNWMSLMNLIEGRRHDFKKIDRGLQSHCLDRIDSNYKKESFYAECQRAALYRVYLFLVLRKNDYLAKQANEILKMVQQRFSIEELTSELQDIISLTKNLYAAKTNEYNILDYALEKDAIDSNNNECRLLAGERRFLYECYKASITDEFNEYQKNLFYIYLSIRTHFRGEMIQVNRQVGFANFKNYQDRKEAFIEGQTDYEDELIRLALNEPLSKTNMVSLEARICPKNRAVNLYKDIRRNEHVVKSSEKKQEDMHNKLFYVLHFPKIPDNDFCLGLPRNFNARKLALKQTKSIVAFLEAGTDLNYFIRGIDTCSSEINCRPEVYAQIYRYLSNVVFSYPDRRERKDIDTKLHLTYHVGEDFLDLVDGIRAIDEAILFCGLSRGSRIGHGLALGINPSQYYKDKIYKLAIPKQVLLDDIAWLLNKVAENGCDIDIKLKTELEEKFNELFEDIYCKHMEEKFPVSVYDYYQSWKLRGDEPSVYRLGESELMSKIENPQKEFLKFDRYCLNGLISNNIRKVEKYRKLYYLYHYNEGVRKTGNEITEFKVNQRYIDMVYQIQNKMIFQLERMGISIETNPSSNYLIGTINKYDEHPILRFNSRKLKNVEPNMSLSVSINTDDQGIFDTLLENEYALMTLALKKAKDNNNQLLYDLEDIYEWVDYVRKMGIEQSFT